MSVTDKDLRAAANVLARALKSEPDIRRAQRVDRAIANDGKVIRDQVIGIIKMIENIDANRDDLTATEINLIDKLTKLKGELNDPVHGTFLYDTFTGSDGTPLTAHTGESGATWTSDGGSFNVTNGRVQGTSTGFVLASGLPPSADYVVFAEFTHLTDAGVNGVAVRIQPGTDTGYYLYYSLGNFRLRKRVNGVMTVLGDYPYAVGSLPVVAGLAIAGDRIDVFVNGALTATVTDTSITARGRAGLRSSSVSPTTGYHLDNVRGSGYVAVVALVETLKNALTTALNDEEADRIAADNALDAAKRALNVAVPEADVEGLSTKLVSLANTDSNLSNDITAVDAKTKTRSKGSDETFVNLSGELTCDVYVPIGPNEQWHIGVTLAYTTSATGGTNFNGVQFGLRPPSATLLEGETIGVPNSGSSLTPSSLGFAGGLTSLWYTTYETSLGYAKIDAIAYSGSTANGVLNVILGLVDTADTVVVKAGSSIIATRQN
jgi:hypothetical protein